LLNTNAEHTPMSHLKFQLTAACLATLLIAAVVLGTAIG
jgi:hypothetical protein